MKRYDVYSADDARPDIEEDPKGQWVDAEEALERIAHLEAEVVKFARAFIERGRRNIELEAAIDKLAQCKGRFHTEANFKALIEVRNKSLHK